MGTRVENPELKKQVEAFVIEKLENCELFVKTYGRGYAAKRLAINFKELYTNELNKKAGGEYQLGTSGKITLFMEGPNGNLLTFDELKKQNGLATTLHECIHAIFNKTPEECKESNISCGSGIHEKYNNSELGRALNEGFTNWVCNKAGLSTMSYASLTNVVNILELAIGPEKVMEFGKGDIAKRISKCLGMDINVCRTFLGKVDQLHAYEDKSTEYNAIIRLIKTKNDYEENKRNIPGSVLPDDLQKSIQDLVNNPLYANLLSNNDYIEFANKNNLKPELEGSKLKYFEHQSEVYSSKSEETKQEIHADLVSKYFMQELVDIIDKGECSFEEYSKFSKLSSLLYIQNDSKNETLQDFKMAFNDLRRQFFDRAENEIKTSLKNGTLTAEQLNQYRNLTTETTSPDARDFTAMVADIMLPENTFAYTSLFNSLNNNDKILEIFNYRIFELYNQKGQKINLFYNTKNDQHFTRFLYEPNIMYANTDITDKDSLFNITLVGLQSMQEIVNNFLSLKDKICQENPNTRLQIVDSTIISTVDGGEPTFYVLDGNEWEEAKVKEFLPKNVQQEKATSLQLESIDTSSIPETGENSLTVVEKNPFKRFFQEIKKRFFKPEVKLAVADTAKIEDDRNAFDYSLRHTEDGKVIETPTISRDTTKSRNTAKDKTKNTNKNIEL